MDDSRASTPPTAPGRRFEELLPRRRHPSPRQSGRPRAAPAPASGRTRLAAREASRARDVRGAARTAIETAARGRQRDGTEATLAATARLQGRARALLHAEAEAPARAGSGRRPGVAEPGQRPGLERGEAAPVPPAPGGPPSGSDAGPLAALADAGARAERVQALVEKVELLLRSGRPALSVSLRAGGPARVELERVGRATVTLRLLAARAPPPEEVNLFRIALATRGLTLRELQWVPPEQAPSGARARGTSKLTRPGE